MKPSAAGYEAFSSDHDRQFRVVVVNQRCKYFAGVLLMEEPFDFACRLT